MTKQTPERPLVSSCEQILGQIERTTTVRGGSCTTGSIATYKVLGTGPASRLTKLTSIQADHTLLDLPCSEYNGTSCFHPTHSRNSILFSFNVPDSSGIK